MLPWQQSDIYSNVMIAQETILLTTVNRASNYAINLDRLSEIRNAANSTANPTRPPNRNCCRFESEPITMSYDILGHQLVGRHVAVFRWPRLSPRRKPTVQRHLLVTMSISGPLYTQAMHLSMDISTWARPGAYRAEGREDHWSEKLALMNSQIRNTWRGYSLSKEMVTITLGTQTRIHH